MTPIPKDYQPNQSTLELAYKLGMDQQYVDKEIPKFIRYYTGRGEYKDWHRGFGLWLQRGFSKVKQRERSTTRTHPGSNTEWQAEKIVRATTRPSLSELKIIANGGAINP